MARGCPDLCSSCGDHRCNQHGKKQTGRHKQVERIPNHYSALERIFVTHRLIYNRSEAHDETSAFLHQLSNIKSRFPHMFPPVHWIVNISSMGMASYNTKPSILDSVKQAHFVNNPGSRVSGHLDCCPERLSLHRYSHSTSNRS